MSHSTLAGMATIGNVMYAPDGTVVLDPDASTVALENLDINGPVNISGSGLMDWEELLTLTFIDGCSTLCQNEVCGDGILQTGFGEECDDGNLGLADGCLAEVNSVPVSGRHDSALRGIEDGAVRAMTHCVRGS
jgi:cysteine-rich repeat protein